jgi:hypothetical protein
MTGTYDPQLDIVFWPVGNPGPISLVASAKDNLTDSILA